MKTSKVIALRNVPYNKREYKPRDKFEASVEDAKLLVMIGACRFDDAEIVQDIAQAINSVIEEESKPAAKKQQQPQYKHRSMRAADKAS